MRYKRKRWRMKKGHKFSLLLLAFLLSGILIGCGGASTGTAQSYYEQGLKLNDESRYQEAIAQFDKAIELNPEYAEAYRNRGIAYDIQGQYERAVQDYDEAIRLNPGSAEAYNDRGISYRHLSQYERAI